MIESRIGLGHADHAVQQQAAADQERKGQGDLGTDEDPLQPPAAPGAGRGPSLG